VPPYPPPRSGKGTRQSPKPGGGIENVRSEAYKGGRVWEEKQLKTEGIRGVLTKRKNGISIIRTGTNNNRVRTELL